MDGLSSAASVIAVIQLTGSIVNICGGYIQEVKDAREEIIALQLAVASLEEVLQKFKNLLQGPNYTKLSTSHTIVDDVRRCLSVLRDLEEKINPGRRQKAMRRLGFRALTWPLKRAEVERIIGELERHKSSFILSLQVDQTGKITDISQNTDRIERNMDLDKLPIARGAEFDSYVDQDEDHCLQGTRTELLHQIAEWATAPKGKCIFWLNGMAGTGKSTISRTMAKSFKQAESLGASFFFKRGEGDRGNAMKLFPTIIRQLVLRLPDLMPAIRQAILEDPEIAAKSLKEQFDKLLLQPLLGLKQSNHPIVIVIDALDECERDNDIRAILRLLPRLRESNAACLRIFLTSRPELPIHLGFSKIARLDYQDLVLHEIPEAVTERDISLFLKDRFAKLRDARGAPLDWPGDNNIQTLVAISVPLFISAATICRFIEDPKWEPAVRLTELLEGQAKYATKMDKTYLPILTRLLDDQDDDESEKLVQQFQEIVGVIILLAIPLSVNTLSQFLGIPEGVISNRLDSFQSVLSVPGNRNLPVRILHLSFRDFLVNSRSKFRVDEQQTHRNIAIHCLATMRRYLKKDICNVVNYGTQRTEIDTQSIHQHLPPELQYSCRYWAHHLAQSKHAITEMDNVLIFLRKHFLHWVEAMSILGLISEVVGILQLLQSDVYDCELSAFLSDAKRFVLKNRQIADDAPLQLYCSGLVFSPSLSIIRREFERETLHLIHTFPKVQETWSAELQTLEGHSGPVRSVAFSPDGELIASASDDQTVRLWDTATGALQQTLEGHSGCVWSVAFSPNGRLVASASFDKVRLWDTATGALQQTLEGHSDPVLSIAFSPDGQLVASASDDQTVRLWDTATGALQQTFRVQGEVTDLNFSENGSYLRTNLGSLNIQSSWCDKITSNLPRANVEMIPFEHQWVSLHGKKVLWLPPEYRPSCSAVKDSTLALGHASGRVSFIGFSV